MNIDLNQIGCKSADWIYQAQDVDKRALCVTNNGLLGSIKNGNVLSS